MNVVVRRANYKFKSSFMYSRIQCACEKLKFLILIISEILQSLGVLADYTNARRLIRLPVWPDFLAILNWLVKDHSEK